MRCLVALSVAVAFSASTVRAWEYVYIDGSEAGTVKACAAVDEYRDGYFLIRLMGDEIDFLIRMDHLTLPYDTLLGSVALAFPSKVYVLEGTTNPRKQSDAQATTSHLFLTAEKSDYADLFDSFRRESRVSIVFPNGDSYGIDLTGTGRALKEASECWRTRPTGPYTNNPFSGEAEDNPFRPQEPSPPASREPEKPVSGNPFDSA